jgi:hypothetical protein
VPASFPAYADACQASLWAPVPRTTDCATVSTTTNGAEEIFMYLDLYFTHEPQVSRDEIEDT